MAPPPVPSIARISCTRHNQTPLMSTAMVVSHSASSTSARGRCGPLDAGIVDGDVEATEARVGDEPRGLLTAHCVDVGDDHAVAPAREFDAGRPPDAGAAPGDQ